MPRRRPEVAPGRRVRFPRVDRRTRNSSTVERRGHLGHSPVRPRAARHAPVGQDVQVPRHGGDVPGQGVPDGEDPRRGHFQPLSRVLVGQPPGRSHDACVRPLPAGGRCRRVPPRDARHGRGQRFRIAYTSRGRGPFRCAGHASTVGGRVVREKALEGRRCGRGFSDGGRCRADWQKSRRDLEPGHQEDVVLGGRGRSSWLRPRTPSIALDQRARHAAWHAPVRHAAAGRRGHGSGRFRLVGPATPVDVERRLHHGRRQTLAASDECVRFSGRIRSGPFAPSGSLFGPGRRPEVPRLDRPRRLFLLRVHRRSA